MTTEKQDDVQCFKFESDTQAREFFETQEWGRKIREDVREGRSSEKNKADFDEKLASLKGEHNPAIVQSVVHGDVGQINKDIEKGRVTIEETTKIIQKAYSEGLIHSLAYEKMQKNVLN